MSDQAESRKRLLLLVVLLLAAGGGLYWVTSRPQAPADPELETKISDLQAILEDAKAEREQQPEPELDPATVDANAPGDMRNRSGG